MNSHREDLFKLLNCQALISRLSKNVCKKINCLKLSSHWMVVFKIKISQILKKYLRMSHFFSKITRSINGSSLYFLDILKVFL